MLQHEIDALKKLRIPLKRWGDDYRVKIRKDGRFVYVSNISKKNYAEALVKQNPKVFKSKSVSAGVFKLKKTINAQKPHYKAISTKNHQTHIFERYSKEQVFNKLNDILRGQKKAFKVAISLGYKLRNIQTGEEIYWSPGTDTYLFDNLVSINSKADVKTKIMDKLNDTDLASKIKYPSSAFKLEEITGFSTSIYFRDHRLGDDKIVIPQVITDNRHIVKHPNTNNKCVFYCIAGFLDPKKDYRFLTKPVKELFKQYCTFKDIEYTLPFFKSFEGVDLLQFDELEDCFQLNINVFEMDVGTTAISPIRESSKNFEKTISILDYKGHGMWIPRIDKLESRHICDRCDRILPSAQKLKEHKRYKCDQTTLESFVNKPTIYSPPRNTIKTLLSKYEVECDHYMDHFIVYDFEAILAELDEERGESTVYTSKHVPVSVSVCDSLSKQVRCFVSNEPKDLLQQMFKYVDEVSGKICQYNKAKFEGLFTAIEEKKKELLANGDTFGMKTVVNNESVLEDVCKQTPLVGFNSGRYDINLIKKDLFSVLGVNNIKMVIKNPNYMCISTETLKIIDITNYLPAGTSYDKYLKSYLGGCKCENKITCVCGLGKGLFPYEYMTSFDKLDDTELPTRSAFDSKLRNTKISDEDYERVKWVWSHYEMKTLKDLLIWYNNLDVEPFIKAVVEQRKFYKTFELDMLMDGLSLPGLAEKIMYQISHKEMKPIKRHQGKVFCFPPSRLSGYQTQDKEAGRDFDITVEYLNGILKGQKFSCYHCGITLIEANASADRKDNKYGHVKDNIVMACIECNVARKKMSIKGFAYKKKLDYNSDRLVYSIDSEEKDIYYKMKMNIAGGPSIIFNRYAKTDETCIRNGSKLVKKVIGYDANALYLWALANEMPCGRLTTIQPYDSMMEDIRDNKLFGFLECDIETPSHLKDYFSEMTPIFKNTEIDPCDRDLIGDHMYDYNLSLGKQQKKQLSRKLIGSYFGKKILVYTPLLKWYLDHGLIITNTYSFIKANAHYAFKSFAGKVSDARRSGDKDVNKAMIAEMMKLVGNAAFGRSGMDKSKHTEVKYHDDANIGEAIENAQFKGFDELDGSYEVSMKKRRIKFNNPIHLSIAIYQLAKLRMLQFYYDCIDFYFDRSDFQYQEMDTDSAYIAFSAENPFEDLIKPELREHFQAHKSDWFPRDDTTTNIAYDRRTPGLFKEEWRGNAIISLASKNYICYDPDGEHKVKISSKGVQGSNDIENKRNADVLCPQAFDSVVKNKVSFSATNKGFRIDKQSQRIITYQQTKTGLSYFYDKRRVLADGIGTEPLDI